MRVLEARGKVPWHRRRGLIVAASLVVLAGVGGIAYGIGRAGGGSGGGTAAGGGGGSGSGGSGGSGGGTNSGGGSGGSGTGHHHHAKALTVVQSSPANDGDNAPTNADISVTFSAPVRLGSIKPTLSPAVAGRWVQPSRTTIRFDLAGPLIPDASEVVTIPGGAHGITSTTGARLKADDTISFTVADGSTLRLQELLAELDYLPLSFTPTGTAAPQDAAASQLGTFAWRWPNLPSDLTSLWVQGEESEITKAAVMSFENQNDLAVDGLAGHEVWTDLLADVASQKMNGVPWVYVLVNKALPQSLTLYNNGVAQYTGIPVNTGAPGADTTDGTYAVFEHVTASRMVGTNPDGSKYDDPAVPWASFFNGGDALHGFVRAQYGFPQSNGCVEMTVANAGMLWPLTPIGTLVTVVGPTS